MKNFILILLALFIAATSFAEEKRKQYPVSAEHQKWLDLVHWIISDYEREAFLMLEKEEDRARMIEIFWENRDPTPGTVQNEFKEEHLKRVEYANKFYGRETSMAGWRTDRGRIYILMGKPDYTKRIPASFDNVSLELWHYVGYKGYGLPSSLYLLFYQPDNMPPYRLYSPLSDGIRDLFIQRNKTSMLPEDALYGMLRQELDPEVAHASISSIPSESADPGSPGTSITTEVILAKLQNARNYDISKRRYVDDFLKDRPSVQVYYSIGREGVHDGLYWFQAPTGDYYIDYSIEYEPDKLDMGSYENYYTSLTVDGLITAPDKTEVEQIVGTHEIKVTPEQFEKIKSMPFQFQGRRPLIPGKYDFTLIVANNVSRKSATFVETIEIPDLTKQSKPSITPVIPVRSIEAAAKDNKIRPFQFGDKIFIPNLPARYSKNAPMLLYHQVIFPDTYASMGTPELHYVVKVGDQIESEQTEPVSIAASQLAGNYIEIQKDISLSALSVGAKTLTVELREGEKTIAKTAPLMFTVSNDAAPNVWKFSVALPGFNSGYHSFLQAQQLLRLKRPKEARLLLEDAHTKDPENLEVTYQLMRAALQEKNLNKVIELGSPLEVKNPRNPQVLWLMGWAYYYSEKFHDALRFFERYRIEEPKKVEALNILADIYFRLDQPAKSLERVEQSLALRPNQKDILDLKKKLQAEQN
ncbi:GWxTD domain-containing protein [bacterium]|nr:GWxTD domain-containing protein [bacterium]MCI0604447.1 GWxTD domain-containing protein [bacterium]